MSDTVEVIAGTVTVTEVGVKGDGGPITDQTATDLEGFLLGNGDTITASNDVARLSTDNTFDGAITCNSDIALSGAGSFIGSGANLTGVPASAITGTLTVGNIPSLPANIIGTGRFTKAQQQASTAYVDQVNTWTGNQTVTGTVAATTFSGSGASLTLLPAGQLTGSVADARLSVNVPLKGTSNTFTATQTFASVSASDVTTGTVNSDNYNGVDLNIYASSSLNTTCSGTMYLGCDNDITIQPGTSLSLQPQSGDLSLTAPGGRVVLGGTVESNASFYASELRLSNPTSPALAGGIVGYFQIRSRDGGQSYYVPCYQEP